MKLKVSLSSSKGCGNHFKTPHASALIQAAPPPEGKISLKANKKSPYIQ